MAIVSLQLCEKYRPTKSSELISQPAIITLRKWLQSRPVAAVLLSGPPGVGKTTAATILAKEAGFTPIELNASDTRSASLIRSALLDAITCVHNCIIVDEIDGMSITDKGGIQELSKLIAVTKCPIVCICNDRQSRQARSLVKSCAIDIKFEPTAASDMLKKLVAIAAVEKIAVAQSLLREIIAAAAGDMRAAINNLHMHCGTTAKDPWQAYDAFTSVRKIFEDKRLTLDDAIELMFVDADLGPLVAHQHILDRETSLATAVKAADTFTIMDMIDARIYGRQSWELLPYKVVEIAGVVRASHASIGWTQFPAVLARASTARKRRRQLDNIGACLRMSTADIRTSWTPLQIIIGAPLAAGHIDAAVDDAAAAGLTRDDMLDVIMELSLYPNEIPAVTTKNKGAFTRLYNRKYGESVKTSSIEVESDEELI